MAYQWSRKFAAEIEFYLSKGTTFNDAHLRFTSTLDGVEYGGVFYSQEEASGAGHELSLTNCPKRLIS